MRTAILIVLSILPIITRAGDSLEVTQPTLSTPLPSFLRFMADPDLSMRATSENLLSIHTGLTRLEDRLIGTTWFDERSLIGKTAGVALRFGKLALIDIPVDYFTVVLQHEYGGHGARYREFGMSGIHYAFDAPPPYGKGGGEASNRLNANASADEAIAMWAGGVESHLFLQQDLAMHWVEKRRVNYREALLYFWAWQISFTYINDTHEDLLDGRTDNDPRAYIRLLNSGFLPVTAATPIRMSIGDLKSATTIGVANPFTFYSIYVALVAYLYQGAPTAEMPMLAIGPVGYLPLLRAGWTPFGVEYHMENYFRLGGRTALVDIGLGDNAFSSGWGSFGIDVRRILDDGHWRLDGGIKLWKQPDLLSGWNPSKNIGNGIGALWRLRVYQDIHGLPLSLHAVGEIGYKSGGFIEGYPMRASPLLMMGLAIRY